VDGWTVIFFQKDEEGFFGRLPGGRLSSERVKIFPFLRLRDDADDGQEG
jgi:hypothetical protein